MLMYMRRVVLSKGTSRYISSLSFYGSAPLQYRIAYSCYHPSPVLPVARAVESLRYASSSSKRWQTRAGSDKFTKEARVQGLMSRAAFKLLQLNEKYKFFKKGQTVVDLGFAPGSWSQVAADRTGPIGRVIRIDIIPAQPPKGVSTIQGNFLSESVQEEVKRFVRDPEQGKRKEQKFLASESADDAVTANDLDEASPKLLSSLGLETPHPTDEEGDADIKAREKAEKVVDVVLSDMSAPWEQITGFQKRSLSNPHFRMMNTSGNNFRDHAGSMDLCNAALIFAYDTLRVGGVFVCKFYQGAEDKAFEKRLKMLFTKVHREKPASSRSESKESYFVAVKRKRDVARDKIFG